MTFFDLYRKIEEHLFCSHIDNPKLEAELFISHTTGLSRAGFILNLKENVPADLENKLEPLIQRRLAGESFASIIGKKYFDQFEFSVNSDVLIPRPETELLVEIIKERMDPKSHFKALDIGTGSGILPVTLSYYLPNSLWDALDISSSALETARMNYNRFPHCKGRIHFIHSALSEFTPHHPYQLIVSNPPYIPQTEAETLIKEKKLSDPLIALTPGTDGLEMYREIRQFCDRHLADGGLAVMEHGMDQQNDVAGIFNGYRIKTYQDLAGLGRAVAAVKS